MKINIKIYFILIFVFTFFLFSVFAIRGVDPHHDGFMFKTAMDVLHGQILYKETFTQYGTLTTYIQAILLFLFGAKLITLKLGTVAFYSAIAVLLFAIGRKFLPLSLNFLIFFFWLLIAPFYRYDWPLLPWSSVYALFFQLLSVLFFIYFITSERDKKNVFLSGIFAGAALWCRLPVGLTLIFAYLLLYFIFIYFKKLQSLENSIISPQKTRQFKFIFAGFAIMNIIFFAILFFSHSLYQWHYQVIVGPRRWLHIIAGPSLERVLWSLFYSPKEGFLLAGSILFILFSTRFIEGKTSTISKWKVWTYSITTSSLITLILYKTNPAILDIFGGWASAVPLIIISYLVFLIHKVIMKKQHLSTQQLMILILAVLALSSWHQYYPVTCYRHVFWGIGPALIPLMLILLEITKNNVKNIFVTMIIFLFPMLFDRITVASHNLNAEYIKIQSPTALSGLYATRSNAQLILSTNEVIQKYLQKKPDTPLLLESVDALYATFVNNFQNPEPFFVNWGYNGPNSSGDRDAFIKKYRPIILMQNRTKESIADYEKKYQYKEQLNIPSINLLIPKELL